MKTYYLLLLTLAAFSTKLFAANTPEYDPSTARAYEAYLLTFVWPDKESSEQVDYKSVIAGTKLPRYTAPNDDNSRSSAANIAQLSVPFDSFKRKIAPHAQVLVNKKWTLIFNTTGATVHETFHSERMKNGYPELTGKIAIKLGRYLESDIQYQHYRFDPRPVAPSDPDTASDQDTQPTQVLPPSLEPTLVLNLEQSNKTASKKLNYIDHPVIGTLIYFEPIALDDAIQQIALEKLTPTAEEAQLTSSSAVQFAPTQDETTTSSQ
ncbi:CsiV family protein [Marinomonas pollencensis]|uniref:Peptidoglycan-binding protein CsiV n=1 Tax=Marinomonas pollencensis TaxID=491954 RepID=A0A3E0DUC8_9GAMM|nr:CsiV family protein [Marinomonas pollencensis]REG86508.1 peptidoglycan-binding protein CsiV [Marinomonas pollencensis]